MRRARSDDAAAARAALGTYVDYMVGDLYDIQIVLYDDSRVAAVDQFVYHLQQLTYILEMQSRGRFVEDVERTSRVALRQLGRQLDALALAARKDRKSVV